MLEGQREGVQRAKREGKYKGRAPTARAKSAEIVTLAEGVKREEIAAAVLRKYASTSGSSRSLIACFGAADGGRPRRITRSPMRSSARASMSSVISGKSSSGLIAERLGEAAAEFADFLRMAIPHRDHAPVRAALTSKRSTPPGPRETRTAASVADAGRGGGLR